MPYCTVANENGNDVNIYYEDFGTGEPVVLIHGWPLSHKMWEQQVAALIKGGYRVISYDRRGFGDSTQTWDGYDYDTLAEDLSKLLDHTGADGATLVGFSMGGGEVARYISKYGTSKLKKAVLMSSVTPYMSKSNDNPEGVDPSVFEGMLGGLTKNRPDFLKGFVKKFYNFDEGKTDVTKENINYDWNIASMASPKGTVDCMKAFSGTDFREDLKKFDIPTLVLHGDSDNIVPIDVSGRLAHELIESSQLVILEGAPHGITVSHPKDVNRELIDFLKS